jgi:autotransporter-associated beta strand protein
MGAGTWIITGTNNYSGGTTIAGGTLQLGNGGTTGDLLGNVTDNGTLTFDRSLRFRRRHGGSLASLQILGKKKLPF